MIVSPLDVRRLWKSLDQTNFDLKDVDEILMNFNWLMLHQMGVQPAFGTLTGYHRGNIHESICCLGFYRFTKKTLEVQDQTKNGV